MWTSLEVIKGGMRGIGTIFEPWHTKRMGDAHAYNKRHEIYNKRDEMLALAQAEKDVKSILDGTLQFDGKSLIATVKTNLNNDVLHQESTHQINICKAIIHAEDAIINDTNIECIVENSKQVDNDWISSWRENVKHISNENMQELWGKILAGEVKSPGKYSMRTLQFMRNLSTIEADEISQLAEYNIHDQIIQDIPINAKEKTFAYFLRMEEFGIIQGVSGIGLTTKYHSDNLDNYHRVLIYGKNLILINHIDPNQKLSIPFLPLTSLGKELLSLCQIQENNIYMDEFIKLIIQQGFTIKTTQEWTRSDCGHKINYFNAKLYNYS